RFIYCGIEEFIRSGLKLLMAVDELNIQQLISYVQEFFDQASNRIFTPKSTDILEAVYQHKLFTDLWNFCLERICKKPKILFDSDNFINLKAPLLEILKKRDGLNMDEIEVWENLL